MEKLLKNELFRSFILSIVIFAVLMIGTATSVINSYWQGVLILCGINIILAVSLNLAAGYLGQLTLGHAGFMSVGAYTSALISIYLNLPFSSIYCIITYWCDCSWYYWFNYRYSSIKIKR